MPIPFNKPVLTGKEFAYIQDAIERGQLAGDGHYTQECEKLVVKLAGAASAHLTHSCTAALEMAALLCDLKPGDEVIMPSFTFVSTANAVVLRGAVPVFVDIEPDTLNIDPRLIEAAITERTKCVFVVHYAGVVCDIQPIRALCDRHGLVLVEDAAQALGSSRDGKPAGSFGELAAFSFHETKNIISGEGGCLVTNGDAYRLRAEIIREKGTNRRAFFRGEVDKYTWVDAGSSYLPGELVSAFLFAQLEKAEDIKKERLKAWQHYHDSFAGLERDGRIRRPVVPDACRHNGHIYYILAENRETRDNLIAHMKNNGVITPFHYVPLHSSPFGKTHSRAGSAFDQTDAVSSRLVRMPMYYGVEKHIDRIADLVLRFFA